MEILAEDLYLKTAAGEMKGKENYLERLTAYEGWKNAHHVQHVNVLSRKKGLYLEADIRYQNIKPNGEKKSYTIHYDTELTKNENALPQFSSIKIVPTGETADNFVDAYPVNRTKSLMHYWLASMENLDRNVSPFKELLADDFTLNFSIAGPIKTFEALGVWLNDRPLQLKESSKPST